MLLFFFFVVQKKLLFFDEKNNIRAETNKIPATTADLTRKSRFWYIKIWIYSISLRKHTMTFLKFKNKSLSKKVLSKSLGITLTGEYFSIFFLIQKNIRK